MRLIAMTTYLIAQIPVSPDPWWTPLANFGIAGIVIGWFMWRDKRESERQDKRHTENLEQQRKIEDAFRTNTTSIIVALSALKSLDIAHSDLVASLKHANENTDRRG